MDRRRLIAVARGDAEPDLVVEGAHVFSAFTREWLDGDVAVADGLFAGVGAYDGGARVDAHGRYLVPGFIDAHMHIESSKLTVAEFARLVIAARHDRDRLRPARDRERARHRRRRTGCSTRARACRSTSS